MAAPPFAIVGEPGTTWTNRTDKIYFQAYCKFQNSCAVCIGVAGQIARFWPFPFHFGCLCRSVPIMPGAESKPFIDYQEAVAELAPSQQAAAMGTSNWAMVNSGLVKWDDVVTRSRVRDFREVVARNKLSIEDLVRSGVSAKEAKKAFNAVHTPGHEQARKTRKTVAAALREHGLADQEILAHVGEKLLERVGIAAGPSGGMKASTVRKPPGWGGAAAAVAFRPRPPAPLTPAAARQALVEMFGEEAVAHLRIEEIKTEADLEKIVALLKSTPAEYLRNQKAEAEYLGFTLPNPILHSPDNEK